MIRRLASFRVLAATAVFGVLARPIHAQIPGVPGINPFSFGVEAGPAFPVGNFGTALKTGFTADALVEARIPLLPVGLRFEGGYTRFGSKIGNTPGGTLLGTSTSGTDVHMVSGSANVVLRLSPIALTLVRPYLIGGVGIYGLNQGLGTKAGVNIGGGLSLPLVVVTTFADLRYTRVFTNGDRVNFVPLRVGVRF